MKKIIAIITLFTFFTCFPAFAFAPLAIPAWYWGASVALHVAGAAAGLYYAMSPSGTSKVTATSSVTRPSNVAWVDLSSKSLNEKSVIATIDLTSMQSLALKNDSSGNPLYPKVKSAVYKNTAPVMSTTAAQRTNLAGQYTAITNNGVTKYYRLESYNSTYIGYGPTDVTKPKMISPYIGIPVSGTESNNNTYVNMAKYTYTEIGTVPPPVAKQQSEARPSLSTDGGASDNVNPTLQSELDKMFQDPDYVPVFSDATTGLPFTPPPSSQVMTPSQLQAYNSSLAAAEAKNNALNSSTAAAAAASGSADSARNAYVASGGDPLTGIGGDQALYQKLKELEASSAAAQAELDKLKADQARDDAEKLSVTVPALESYGDGTEYKFGDRFNSFLDDMKQSSVFSLPGQMLGSIPGGGQSYFNLSFGRFGQTTFDLSSYGASINIIKTLVLIIFSIAGIRIVTLKGGS